MPPLPLDPDLHALITNANHARREALASDGPRTTSPAEQRLVQQWDANRRLAVYGTLAPGQSNHHMVAGLDGAWSRGFVTGELWASGWGARYGFPALRWDPAGDPLAVSLLSSRLLPEHWSELDAFEGDEYLRILVPVFDSPRADARLLTVANLYGVR
jgi:gamma-glutamylcyclotransferase (GGCT)/AIG2-like uncharacterized protein YtfP